MSSRCMLLASFLIVALNANSALAEPPAPKDGPLGMKFVPLSKGTFYMGWDGEKSGKKTEIKVDFQIAVCTVTQGQWQALMKDNPSNFARNGDYKVRVKDFSDADLKHFPLENVSWDMARDFIKELNEKERGNGWKYRLPTEAEWEYACRNGAASQEDCSFHFYFAKPTNDLSSAEANFKGRHPAGNATKGKYLERPEKVGSYKANMLGLFDMHGNVRQWCADLYEEGGSDRVVRGGGWSDDGSDCRASARVGCAPSKGDDDVGFRLVRVRSGGK